MVEIFEKRVSETFEKPGLKLLEEPVDVKLLERKTHGKTYRGYLQGCLQKARNDKNKELEVLFDELIRKFNTFYPDKVIKVVIIEGWEKTNGDFYIGKDVDNDFVVEIWHKEQKEVKKVPKEHLNDMLYVIRQLEIGKNYTCYDIAKLMGYSEWKELWANRMTEYFPLYYIPLKIFNELGVVHYGGNKKNIVRLK
jgi:hypothetical protein